MKLIKLFILIKLKKKLNAVPDKVINLDKKQNTIANMELNAVVNTANNTDNNQTIKPMK